PRTDTVTYEQFTRVIHPDDLPTAEAVLRKIFLQKTQESAEIRAVRPDGEIRYGYASGGPVLDRQGNVSRVVGIVVDITERKHAEEELRSLTTRLSLATRASSAGVWDLDLHTERAIWDDTMFEIFARPKAASVSREEWWRWMHPEDRLKAESFV